MNAKEIEELEQSIAEEELLQAIEILKPGKSPSQDEPTAQYYKTFAHLLKTPLLQIFNSLSKPQDVPNSFSQAQITVLPKPNKDVTETRHASYRPIFLLNLDVKLLAKILVNHLRPLLSKVIGPGKVGLDREAIR